MDTDDTNEDFDDDEDFEDDEEEGASELDAVPQVLPRVSRWLSGAAAGVSAADLFSVPGQARQRAAGAIRGAGPGV